LKETYLYLLSIFQETLTYKQILYHEISLDNLEWKLKEDIFKRICHHYFIPNIDLFATRHNTQLERFASWHFDSHAVYTDVLSFSWSDVEPYIFPPFSLIGKVISKIFLNNVQRAILIVPFWLTQNWFPLLILALICNPGCQSTRISCTCH
jgi:hypothetical protein